MPFTAHGFRSSFRDWAGNETTFPRELAEHALAHVIRDKAEQAYRRSDALVRRRELMDAWARHCEGGARGNVWRSSGRRSTLNGEVPQQFWLPMKTALPALAARQLCTFGGRNHLVQCSQAKAWILRQKQLLCIATRSVAKA